MTDSLQRTGLYEPPDTVPWAPAASSRSYLLATTQRPSLKSLLVACGLFFITFCTCLIAGTQFAAAFADDQPVSWQEFLSALTLTYRHPGGLAKGLPFALTLLAILLAHELGHVFACRHHQIRASYPFFIPAPTLIGTFGAFILIRSPIRTTRALFDVGASGPIVGFVFAIPALAYGVIHAKWIPGLSNHSEFVFGVPLALRALIGVLHPGAPVHDFLLHPVGRAAWVGLFATSLNLLPAGQLDGGHILRSLTPRGHRYISFGIPACLLGLGLLHFWYGWFVWAALLLGLLFLRSAPMYDATPLDRGRKLAAVIALLVFLLCFMPAPI